MRRARVSCRTVFATPNRPPSSKRRRSRTAARGAGGGTGSEAGAVLAERTPNASAWESLRPPSHLPHCSHLRRLPGRRARTVSVTDGLAVARKRARPRHDAVLQDGPRARAFVNHGRTRQQRAPRRDEGGPTPIRPRIELDQHRQGQQQLLAGYVAVREAVVRGRHSASELKGASKDAPSDAQKRRSYRSRMPSTGR